MIRHNYDHLALQYSLDRYFELSTVTQKPGPPPSSGRQSSSLLSTDLRSLGRETKSELGLQWEREGSPISPTMFWPHSGPSIFPVLLIDPRAIRLLRGRRLYRPSPENNPTNYLFAFNRHSPLPFLTPIATAKISPSLFLSLLTSPPTSCHLNFLQLTDSLYLNISSFHPSHTKQAIPYTKFIRLPRFCSRDQDFETQSQYLTRLIMQRGYSSTLVN